MSAETAKTRGRAGFFARLVLRVRGAFGRIRPAAGSAYRPEKHYMRGAGPKSKPARSPKVT